LKAKYYLSENRDTLGHRGKDAKKGDFVDPLVLVYHIGEATRNLLLYLVERY